MDDLTTSAFLSLEIDAESCAAGTVSPEQYAFILMLWRQGVSIIPIPHGSKVPKRAWKQYQRELPSEDQISRWFGPRFGQPAPRTNYAILAGEISDLVIVDTDSLEAEAWAVAHLPPTPWMTRTRQGRHRYYRHPIGIPVGNRVKLHTNNEQIAVDLRGDGGYCIGPHSVHETGTVYEIDGDWSAPKESLPIFDPVWLPSEPHLTAVPSLPSLPAPTRPTVHLASPISDADAFLRAEQYVYAMGPAVQGQGGDLHTFRVAAALVIDWALSDADALIILNRWNSHCQPPWSQDDLARKLASARATATGHVGRLRETALNTSDHCTPEDYLLIGQAREMLAAQERAALPTQPAQPALTAPAPTEPVIHPWDCQPFIETEQPQRDYCGKVVLQLTGGDKGFDRKRWLCGQWRCGKCAPKLAVRWLTHMAEHLRTYRHPVYIGIAPSERTLAAQIYRQFVRAHEKGTDVQYLRVTRSDVVGPTRLARMAYLTTWAPLEPSSRGRRSSIPGIHWDEVSPVEAHAWLRDIAIRLPGASRVEAGTPGKGTIPRWKLPERETNQSGRRAVVGSEKRLEASLHAARSRVFDACLQAGVLPPEIVVGEAINDVTARHMFEAAWVDLAQSSSRLGADEYEW